MVQLCWSRWVAGVLLLTMTASGSYGWNKPTHMVIGATAHKPLKVTSPQILSRALTLLRQHPGYAGRWARQRVKLNLTDQERDENLFLLAARLYSCIINK